MLINKLIDRQQDKTVFIGDLEGIWADLRRGPLFWARGATAQQVYWWMYECVCVCDLQPRSIWWLNWENIEPVCMTVHFDKFVPADFFFDNLFSEFDFLVRFSLSWLLSWHECQQRGRVLWYEELGPGLAGERYIFSDRVGVDVRVIVTVQEGV